MEKILQPGIILVDKPTAVSSHAVVKWARIHSGIEKIGHTGTLDPLATGLLIILIGKQYTRLQSQYLQQDKEYICTAQLGLTTDSYDICGTVTAQANWDVVSLITQEAIAQCLVHFTGKTVQTVPIFSAVKQKGKRLYELALSGKADSVVLPSREVTIYALELLTFESNQKSKTAYVTFKVSCNSGMYVRSLAHDIGTMLGVGATVTALRRTKIGALSVDQAAFCPLILEGQRYK